MIRKYIRYFILISKNPDLAKMIKEAGHEIGNHAYSHPDLKQRSVAQTKEELKKTNDVIKATLGITPIWFAPPSGSFNEATIQVADQLGMNPFYGRSIRLIGENLNFRNG